MRKLTDFSFFTDENIDPLLVSFLREVGFDVFDTKENNLYGSTDTFLLDLATNLDKIIITLDSDFGNLIYKHKKPFCGIIFLKPGHFSASVHIETFQALLKVNPDLESPMMITAEWAVSGIKIRIKNAIEIW